MLPRGVPRNRSGGRTRTADSAIMSRVLCQLSYTALEPPYGIEP
jgi:hypothetical protein